MTREAEWVQAETPAVAERLVASGLSERVSRLLARRGVEDETAARAFLQPALEDLHDPFLLDGMEVAVARLLLAAERSETVVVVGDYDVDGISATALLAAVFRAVGVETTPILPHRMRDGYGFQPRQVEAAEELGAKVIVTADCGSHSHEAVGLALAAGIDVIVTDHHLPGEEHPPEVVHINPLRDDDDYPFPHLCGAGLAFKLASAVAQRAGREIAPELLLRIACLGTVADMVPLRGENRTIAALGLRSLPDTKSAGLKALMQVAGISGGVKAGDVGFRLGPRINAAGRMDSPDLALELLLTRDERAARDIARQLDDWNGERQKAEAKVVEEAIEHFEAMPDLPSVLVAAREEWHRGVVGIAAGRLSRRFHRPTVLLSVEGDLAVGSGRSIEGVHLHDFLSAWRDRLERFGGHSQAIGLTVQVEDLPSLEKEWNDAAADWEDAVLVRSVRFEEEISAADVNSGLLEEVQRLEPFGIGNPRPVFRVRGLRCEGTLRRFGKGHLSCRACDDSGAEVDLLGWRWQERAEVLQGEIEVLGTISLDRYTGRTILELIDARPEAVHA